MLDLLLLLILGLIKSYSSLQEITKLQPIRVSIKSRINKSSLSNQESINQVDQIKNQEIKSIKSRIKKASRSNQESINQVYQIKNQ